MKKRVAKKTMTSKATDAKGSEYTRAMDAFQNVLARLGTNTPNLMEGTAYPLTRLTRNYQLMNSLYRSHWIIRKIIDVPQEDMLKNWVDLNTDTTPELLDKFQRTIRKTNTRQKLLTGLKWGRLYGGAAGIIMIDGHEDILNEPLDYDAVMPDSYKGLLIVDRWSGISPSIETVEDINSPDFGIPEKYIITVNDGKTYDVHSSRVIRFIGRDLPKWESQAEQGWSISEIELIFDELKKRDNTSWNIASLIFLANIRVLKMGDLAQILGTNNEKAQQQLYNTLQSQNWLMSNMGMMVLNKDDDFDSKQLSFSGLNDIYQSFMLDIAGCAEMPVTKLFGRAPAGMNATGESDLQNYEDTITGRKESHLRPALDKLFPIVALSTWGKIPDDFDYTFRPSRTLTNEDRANLAEKKGKVINDQFLSGLISKVQGLKELQQLEDETGMFSNITDEDIEAAKLEPSIPDEMDIDKLLNPDKGAELPV